MKFHHRAVPIVLAAVLIESMGFGIVLPVLPRLIVELAHVTLADAARISGYMLVAFSLAQLIAAPIFGSLGDTVGRRPVLLLSMIAFSADYALMAVAPTIGWLFLGRVIAGIAGASYGPANAVLADVTPRRYFCTACHVPQADTPPLVGNSFVDMSELGVGHAGDE